MKTKSFAFWLFILPVLVALCIVIIIPFIYGIYYSFTNWNGDTTQVPDFVGLSNYMDLLSDDTFKNALWFTFKYSIASVIIVNIIGLSLALLVTSRIKSKNFLRTIFFMPNLIGGLILGFIWQFIFTKVFASIGESIGSEWMQGWLSNTSTGFWGLVILTT